METENLGFNVDKLSGQQLNGALQQVAQTFTQNWEWGESHSAIYLPKQLFIRPFIQPGTQVLMALYRKPCDCWGNESYSTG